MFSLTPQELDSVTSYTRLCQRHRGGDATVTRELLGASLAMLSGQARHYESPGLVVSDFWVAVEKGYQTPRDIRCYLATLRRNRSEKATKRETRDTLYQEMELGASTAPDEGLASRWFHSLGADDQELLLMAGIEELPDAMIAERLGQKVDTVKKRRQRLLAELKDFLSPDNEGTGHLSDEPGATPNKPSARGSKRTK